MIIEKINLEGLKEENGFFVFSTDKIPTGQLFYAHIPSQKNLKLYLKASDCIHEVGGTAAYSRPPFRNDDVDSVSELLMKDVSFVYLDELNDPKAKRGF